MESKQNKWWTNWSFWVSSAFIIFFGYRYLSDYFTTRNSEYGQLANSRRQLMGIPVISDYLKPASTPTNKYQGIRWETNKNPTPNKRLIHRWKNVEANETDGWLEERDALRFYIDDSPSWRKSSRVGLRDGATCAHGHIHNPPRFSETMGVLFLAFTAKRKTITHKRVNVTLG
ncbi:MAG: hypothetical protein OEY56_09405 [Cyclobacteriaceae bacterium]|nr:hypothetical protein [Cyclobacteriaceae bacterium]